MNEINEKYLRPGRKTTDQFIIAAVLGSILIFAGGSLVPAGLFVGPFERILGGNHDAAVFLLQYFSFLGVWIVFFLAAVIFKGNRPMLQAVKYCSPSVKGAADSAADRKANRAGNNLRGLLIGLALGFGCNGFCILMSVLLGDIHIRYSGFEPLSFVLFFICVFIQSAAEELAERWYLYQKLRRRYKAPWMAIIVNSLVFMALHLFNPGISLLALIQLFLVGAILSLLVYYYNGLWIAAAFHAAWNFTQSIFFGLPNSGVVSAYSVFRLDAASAKNGLFYNVNFGVEGSAGAAAVLIAVGAAIVLKNRGKAEHTDIWAKAEQTAVKA